MVLQYCSDLHLEFRENKQFINQHPLQPKAEILILAGDIVPFSEMNKRKDFFNYISGNFKISYWLPGNHEYYYSDAAERSGSIRVRRCLVQVHIRSLLILFMMVAAWVKVLTLFYPLTEKKWPKEEQKELLEPAFRWMRHGM